MKHFQICPGSTHSNWSTVRPLCTHWRFSDSLHVYKHAKHHKAFVSDHFNINTSETEGSFVWRRKPIGAACFGPLSYLKTELSTSTCAAVWDADMIICIFQSTNNWIIISVYAQSCKFFPAWRAPCLDLSCLSEIRPVRSDALVHVWRPECEEEVLQFVFTDIQDVTAFQIH